MIRESSSFGSVLDLVRDLGANLPIEHIHTYLVHPGKGVATPRQITGADVKLEGKLFDVLEDIYSKSDTECDVDISFNQSSDGKQKNPCRDLITTYVAGPTLARGRHIAERLESVTTNRSGLGLFFLITGKEGRDHKLVISRFPADSGILADDNRTSLTVEFLERIFMKNALSYKAVLYRDSSLSGGFWTGRAIDKQINNPVAQVSNYWIEEFLDSGLRTTGAAGTRRLAVALRAAARNSKDIDIKSEIVSAVTLAAGLKGRRTSIKDFEDQFGMSPKARDAIANELKDPSILTEKFHFDAAEFSTQLAYRSLELDTGVLVRAEAADFDKLIKREVIDDSKRRVRVSAEGTVTSENLGKAK